MPSGNKPLPEPMLSQICIIIWCNNFPADIKMFCVTVTFVWLSPSRGYLTPHEHQTYPVVGSYWSEIITDLDGGLLPYKRLRLTCFLNYGWHNCCSVHVSGTKTSIFWSHALSQGQKHQYFDHIRRLQCMDFVCQTRNNSSVINLI